jgi:hypothetical protein
MLFTICYFLLLYHKLLLVIQYYLPYVNIGYSIVSYFFIVLGYFWLFYNFLLKIIFGYSKLFITNYFNSYRLFYHIPFLVILKYYWLF